MILNTVEGYVGATPSLATVTVVGNTDGSYLGNTINEYSVMTLPTFWSCVRFITETLASLPRVVTQEDDDGSKQIAHSLVKLLNRKINGYATCFTTFETWFLHATVWGNGYLKKCYDAGGKVVALINVNPELVQPFLYKGEKYFYIDIKQDDNGNPIAQEDRVCHNEDILHLALLGFDGIRGYPIIRLMWEALTTNKTQQIHTNNYFRKGGFVRGSLEIPGVLTDEQLRTLRQSLTNFKGTTSEFDYLILQAGAKLNNSTASNEAAQLIESRQFSTVEICQMLRIPPHIVYQMGDAKWANVEQMGLEVIKYSLMSWIEKAEEELSSKLLTEQEQDSGLAIEYDFASLMRGDMQSRATYVTTIINNGLAVPNWGAKELGLPSLGAEGDRLRVPVAYSAPIAPIGNSKEAPASPIGATESDDSPKTDVEAAPPEYAAVIAPLIADAIERIETKTSKAWERQQGKSQQEITVWGNIFAEEQLKYVKDAFAPIAKAALSFGKVLDTSKLGERYATEIKRLAATKEKRDLSDLAKEIIV